MSSRTFRLPIKPGISAAWIALALGMAMGSLVRAQAPDSLSSILNLPQLNNSDDLPPPTAKPSQQPTAQTPKTAEPPASERIYLGLDAEPPAEGIGVRVVSVAKDSPAWKAGFKVDDRILGISGFAIGKIEDMVDQLAKTRPGQSVNFLINREGRNTELVAVLMNADVADQIQNKAGSITSATAWFGVTAYDLSGSFRDQFGLGAFRGAAVTQVTNGSPAHRAGIRPGDAIVEIAGRAVESAAELQRWVESGKPGDQAQVVYFRGAARQTAKVVLSADPQAMVNQPSTPRVQAFPKSGTVASGLGPAKPGPATGPMLAPGNSGQVAPSAVDPNAPLILSDKNPPANQALTQPSAREVALEAEVQKLRKELSEAQTKLAEAKQQLDNILKALKD